MSDPVTVVVRRRVRAGCEAEYEAWLAQLTKGVAQNFEGYLGAEFSRPRPGGAYRSVFHFDRLDHLEAFESSDFRTPIVAEAADYFDGEAAWDRMTGLEFWFGLPHGTRMPQPSPHRMALVLIAVIFFLVLALNLALGPAMAG
ncbi:antibiotic biosynthesis monooxygenase [Tropicimonas sp. IMCC6043]|uniref:antibiotic biosynthesis monooxygenase n=1 Tax=Tropicimonas sp. IMCC6043 TaxID=2510645 RepID=UPI00101BD706|nr:antibiotic biosynthesis monooxygenase [Tropicimonas sp. IMCC6043]RYH07605.1 antibiotic biosynthesis monooxygenase [Tropicimonas sp. IMCC6043]